MRERRLANAAARFGSPVYVYDFDLLRRHVAALRRPFAQAGIEVLYAMKANSNAALLRILHEAGLGFDACSVGEVELLQRLGIDPSVIHWNADAVSLEEMRLLARSGVNLTVGSLDHLRLLVDDRIAWRRNISLRVNTGFGAGHSQAVTTGGELSKFGLSPADLPAALQFCEIHGIPVTGLHAHAGSGIDTPEQYMENARRLFELALSWPGRLTMLNIGGGFPHDYRAQGEVFDLDRLATELVGLSRPLQERFPGLRLVVEPGRYVVAGAGVLLCTVTSVKRHGDRTYVSVDTGFNHLARPFLYDAFHRIDNLSAPSDAEVIVCDIVGNLCQSGDVFARGRTIAQALVGDLLCIRDAGAYGYSMSSNYNMRPRPAEVAIMEGELMLIRERETLDCLLAGQRLN